MQNQNNVGRGRLPVAKIRIPFAVKVIETHFYLPVERDQKIELQSHDIALFSHNPRTLVY